jgi:type IV pilus assembly protein PilE
MRINVPHRARNLHRAFTLIELMIALAVAAILAAFAVPSYRQHLARGHRVDAVAALYRAAHYLETWEGSLPSRLPDGLDRVPAHGAPVYDLVLRTADEPGGYRVEARPAPDGAMRDDACGTYVLHADGVRENRNGELLPDRSGTCWFAR